MKAQILFILILGLSALVSSIHLTNHKQDTDEDVNDNANGDSNNDANEDTKINPTNQEQQAAGRFLTFIYSDDNRFLAMMKGQATPQQNKEVLHWFLNDPYYSQQFIDQIKNQQGNDWMASLSDKNAKRVAEITFDTLAQTSLFNIFSPDQQDSAPTQQQIRSLIENYLNENDQIANAFIGSMGFDQNTDNHVYTNSLKAANRDWLDWDFQNLTLKQKKQIVLWILDHPAYQTEDSPSHELSISSNHFQKLLNKVHQLINSIKHKKEQL